MTLNLTDTNIQSNYYLREIKKVDDHITTVQGNMNTINNELYYLDAEISGSGGLSDRITNLEDQNEVISSIKFNTGSLDTSYKYFNNDMVGYWDFSDKENVGKDITGNNLHAENNTGVIQTLDLDGRKYSAFFDRIAHATHTSAAGYKNQRFLSLDEHVDRFKLFEYSISLWFYYTDVNGGTMFSLANNSVVSSVGQYFCIRITNSQVRVLNVSNGVVDLDIKTNATINQWNHIVVSMTPSGNDVYLNDTLLTVYAVGSETTYIDLSTYGLTNVSMGAIRENIGSHTYSQQPEYKFAYAGYLSDVSFYNRALTVYEVHMLFIDHYGYSVIALLGQSNCVGRPTIEAGIDDDYTLHNGKVGMYITKTNVNDSTYTIDASDISEAVNPMPHPDSQAVNNGFWRTFCNDLIQYSYLPYRRKILIVPCANGGTGFISNNWKPGNKNYQIACSALNDVLDPLAPTLGAFNRFNKLMLVIWNQGEKDMATPNVNYEADFNSMLTGFETDITTFSKTHTDILLTEISGDYGTHTGTVGGETVQVQNFINNILFGLDNNPNMKCVKTLGLPFMSDYIHLNEVGQRALGSRYYDAFIELTEQQSKKAINNELIILNKDDITAKKVVANEISVGQIILPVEVDGFTNIPLSDFIQRTMTLDITGAVAGTPSMTLTFIKLGKMVILHGIIPTFTTEATQGDILVAAGQIPSVLFPTLHGGVIIIVAAEKTLTGGLVATQHIYLRFAPDGRIIFTDEADHPMNIESYLAAEATYDIRQFSGCYMTE